MKFCPVKNKKILQKLQYKWAYFNFKPKNKIRQAQSGDIVDRNLRKYITGDFFKKSIKIQCDAGSYILAINWRTWQKLNKSTLIKSDKTAKALTGEMINI